MDGLRLNSKKAHYFCIMLESITKLERDKYALENLQWNNYINKDFICYVR